MAALCADGRGISAGGGTATRKSPPYLHPIPLGCKTPQRRIPFRLYRLKDKPYLRQRQLLRP
jgi:hypothetical protein